MNQSKFNETLLVAVSVAAMSVLVDCASNTAQQTASQPSSDDYYQPLSDLVDRSEDADGGLQNHGAQEPDRLVPRVLVRRAPRSRGSLDGDVAGRVIFEHEERLRQCHVQAGGEVVGRGVVFVLLDVTPGGIVDGVLIGYSDVVSTSFMECLERELGALAMPASSGSSVVQAYLVFGARHEDEGRAMLRAYRASRAARAEVSQQAVPLTEVRQRVQGCAERAFRGGNIEAGRVVLRLTLHDDGRVDSVEVTEDTFEGRLNTCIHTVVEKLSLELEEDVERSFSYAVIITPGHDDRGANTD